MRPGQLQGWVTAGRGAAGKAGLARRTTSGIPRPQESPCWRRSPCTGGLKPFSPWNCGQELLTCSCGHPVRTSESGLGNAQRVLRQGRDGPNQGMRPRKPGRQRGAPSITSWTPSWLLGTRGSPGGWPESAVQVSARPASGVSGGAAGELPGAQSREYLHTQRRRVKGRSVNSQFQGRWRKRTSLPTRPS